MKGIDFYLNRIYSVLEEIPFEKIADKANKILFSNGDLLFNSIGSSVEFNQYKDYIPGDPIKSIDWKQYAKKEKLYLKKYHAESNNNIIFIIDTSNSMNFKNKFDYALTFLGIISHISVKLKSKFSIAAPNDFSGFKSKTDDFLFLYDFISKNNQFNIAKTLNFINSVKETQNSSIIIISDFMFEIEEILNKVNELKERGYGFIFIQTLTKEELFLDYKGVVKFKDMETGKELITEPLTIKKIYLEELNKHNEKIRAFLTKENMNYKLLNTTKDLKEGILELFGR